MGLRTRSAVIALLVMGAMPVVAASGLGVDIKPSEEGVFAYEDDFTTPQCLVDAFLKNAGPEFWQQGMLTTKGPNRNRTITYRFHGVRVLTGIEVLVDQRTNARHLGGRTTLYVSSNGLDWTSVATNTTQKGDANGWQMEPLALSAEQAEDFTGHTEVWVRLVLDNYSGLKTSVSNIINKLSVTLTVGDEADEIADPQADLRKAWGELRQSTGWRNITLDTADPTGHRAPHYYEDADGWLREPGETQHLRTDEGTGFLMQLVYRSLDRSPLSLAAFVETQDPPSQILARITVRSSADSSRHMRVLWDGELVSDFDVASYFEREQAFLVELPRSPAGVHELRVRPGDEGAITVTEIALASGGHMDWSTRPALPRTRSLEVLAAQYMPDPEPPAASQVVEGRPTEQEVGLVLPGLQQLYKGHGDFGALSVILRNSGATPIRIADDLQLNGKPIGDSYVDFATSDWDARGIVWYRVQPRLVAPGQCAEVYVRFRKRPEGPSASLTIPCENAEAVAVDIPYRSPAAIVDYVTADRGGRNLYVYVRRVAGEDCGPVTEVALDGQTVRRVELFGADLKSGVALAVARLRDRLEPSSYHVVSVTTDSGDVMAARFRVLPWFFPRSSIHVPPAMCDEMNMNLAMWHFRGHEDCEKYDLFTSTNTHRMFDAHDRVRYILGPDEPDAHDNRGGGYGRGLGHHARRLMDSGWQELVQSQAPHVATWLIMNGTTRPLNWSIYGQLADICCFDPYPINFYGGDHAYVRESLSYARLCGAPRRMYACLEAFGWSAGQGVPSNRRGPLPQEWRQNVVQALGAGAKGLTSWVYSAGAGGWQLNEPARNEIAAVNGLIAGVEDELLLGCPVDWASTDAGTVPTGVVGEENWPKERVWAGALLCGPDTLLVAAANHIPAGKPEPPEITPAENVTITVQLPEYLADVSAFEATDDGLRPVPCTVDDGRAILRVDTIESGRLFVLKRP